MCKSYPCPSSEIILSRSTRRDFRDIPGPRLRGIHSRGCVSNWFLTRNTPKGPTRIIAVLSRKTVHAQIGVNSRPGTCHADLTFKNPGD